MDTAELTYCVSCKAPLAGTAWFCPKCGLLGPGAWQASGGRGFWQTIAWAGAVFGFRRRGEMRRTP